MAREPSRVCSKACEEPDCIAFLLAARFCSSLTTFDAGTEPKPTDHSRRLQELLMKLIVRNKRSLRIVRPGILCDEAVFYAICDCLLLEEFSDECADTWGWSEAMDYDAFQSVMAGVTAAKLPQLRSLTLCNPHRSVEFETQQLLKQRKRRALLVLLYCLQPFL